MALDLKLDIHTTDDCRNLVIEDITGNFSEDNLGGWGELNLVPYKNNTSIDILIKVYFLEGEELISSEASFSLDVFQNFAEMPFEGVYRKFKLALPVETLKAEIEGLDGFETVEDNLYQIGVRVYDTDDITNEYAYKEFIFKNTCMTSKLVSKAFANINFQCEDCDDSDIEKALLAKSLLESLENV
tara:strand:+ start:25 stop:582 length:558 start_codon:yes stop_codon:yes gene_type:complete